MKDEGEMGNIYISSEQIIAEVQKFRCLYDPGHADHKDRDVMRDAWASVTAAVVGEPWDGLNSAEKSEAVKEARRKWRNIKDTMRKSILHGSSPAETDSFKNLLEDEDKSSAGPRTKKCRSGSKKKRPTTRPTIHVMGRVTTSFDESDSSLTSPPEQDTILEQELSNKPVHQHSTGLPGRLNPDWMFMFSLLPRVGALRSRDKLDFQIKVMKLLQGYRTDDSSL